MKILFLSLFILLNFKGYSKATKNPHQTSKTNRESLLISNQFLEVMLLTDKPIVRSYLYKATNSRFEGADETGTIVLNGESIPWSQWKIQIQEIKVPVWQGTWYTYQMSMPGKSFRFDLCFMLVDQRMIFQLKNIQDPK